MLAVGRSDFQNAFTQGYKSVDDELGDHIEIVGTDVIEFLELRQVMGQVAYQQADLAVNAAAHGQAAGKAFLDYELKQQTIVAYVVGEQFD